MNYANHQQHDAAQLEVEVLLDGKVVPACLEANAAEGWVRCYQVDENNLVMLDASCNPIEQRKTGTVFIRRKAP